MSSNDQYQQRQYFKSTEYVFHTLSGEVFRMKIYHTPQEDEIITLSHGGYFIYRNGEFYQT